jgi:beta-1,4-mannosyl-glycoprotein beta-1,4-N-acetylglucosaminyltransferase
MGKIYDCFNFFNELDLLEIRLNTLYDVIDHFVIIESDLTHSGEDKPFYYDDNKARFEKFADKIIHYKVSDTPNQFNDLQNGNDETLNKIYSYINSQTKRFNRDSQPDYGRDFFQKECVMRPLVDCSDDDIIIISDLDEIPNPEILNNINTLNLTEHIYRFNQNMYCYYLNVLKEKNWFGSRILNYGKLKNLSINEVRGDNKLSVELPNGGWHFSFMGGKEMVRKKITSYSARDLGSSHVINSIESNMENNIDPFFRGTLTEVVIDDSYPKYILDNLDKYKHMIR